MFENTQITVQIHTFLIQNPKSHFSLNTDRHTQSYCSKILLWHILKASQYERNVFYLEGVWVSTCVPFCYYRALSLLSPVSSLWFYSPYFFFGIIAVHFYIRNFLHSWTMPTTMTAHSVTWRSMDLISVPSSLTFLSNASRAALGEHRTYTCQYSEDSVTSGCLCIGDGPSSKTLWYTQYSLLGLSAALTGLNTTFRGLAPSPKRCI
jgi:hypothetical protein